MATEHRYPLNAFTANPNKFFHLLLRIIQVLVQAVQVNQVDLVVQTKPGLRADLFNQGVTPYRWLLISSTQSSPMYYHVAVALYPHILSQCNR